MKFLSRLSFLLFPMLLAAQQNTLTQTSLSAGISRDTQTFSLASVTGVSTTPTATLLYVEQEAMPVISVSGTAVTVVRGYSTRAVAHPSGAMVLLGAPSLFYSYAPSGACTTANTLVTPWVNTVTGAQYLCSTVTGTWVAGFQNELLPLAPTAVVASAAGLITPSGPLFHVTGTAAVTGFNIPVGFAYGSFTVIPDAAFTTTNANNIALASTAVAKKAITFVYDPVTALFYPSY